MPVLTLPSPSFCILDQVTSVSVSHCQFVILYLRWGSQNLVPVRTEHNVLNDNNGATTLCSMFCYSKYLLLSMSSFGRCRTWLSCALVKCSIHWAAKGALRSLSKESAHTIRHLPSEDRCICEVTPSSSPKLATAPAAPADPMAGYVLESQKHRFFP